MYFFIKWMKGDYVGPSRVRLIWNSFSTPKNTPFSLQKMWRMALLLYTSFKIWKHFTEVFVRRGSCSKKVVIDLIRFDNFQSLINSVYCARAGLARNPYCDYNGRWDVVRPMATQPTTCHLFLCSCASIVFTKEGGIQLKAVLCIAVLRQAWLHCHTRHCRQESFARHSIRFEDWLGKCQAIVHRRSLCIDHSHGN